MLLIVISFSSYAQGRFRVGFKGGYGLTMLYNDNYYKDGSVTNELSTGGTFGASVGFNAARYNWGVTLGLFIRQYQQRWKADSWHSITKLNYFEAPFLFRLRPAGNKVTKKFTYAGPYFEIGVQPGFLLKDAQVISDTNGIVLPDQTYESFNLSGVIGIGYHQVGVEKWAVTHGIRLTYGLVDIISAKNNNGTAYAAYKPTNSISVIYLLAVSYKFTSNSRRAR